MQPLAKLIEKQRHKTLVLWSIDCAERVLPIFEEKYLQDERPRKAIEAAKAWAHGEIKMPVAKKAAHATHNAATEVVNIPLPHVLLHALQDMLLGLSMLQRMLWVLLFTRLLHLFMLLLIQTTLMM